VGCTCISGTTYSDIGHGISVRSPRCHNAFGLQIPYVHVAVLAAAHDPHAGLRAGLEEEERCAGILRVRVRRICFDHARIGHVP